MIVKLRYYSIFYIRDSKDVILQYTCYTHDSKHLTIQFICYIRDSENPMLQLHRSMRKIRIIKNLYRKHQKGKPNTQTMFKRNLNFVVFIYSVWYMLPELYARHYSKNIYVRMITKYVMYTANKPEQVQYL